jgi:hypothetical protein
VNQDGPSGTAHGSSEVVKAHTPRRGRHSCRNIQSESHTPVIPLPPLFTVSFGVCRRDDATNRRQSPEPWLLVPSQSCHTPSESRWPHRARRHPSHICCEYDLSSPAHSRGVVRDSENSPWGPSGDLFVCLHTLNLLYISLSLSSPPSPPLSLFFPLIAAVLPCRSASACAEARERWQWDPGRYPCSPATASNRCAKEITTLLQILRQMNLAKWRETINTAIGSCQESKQINN